MLQFYRPVEIHIELNIASVSLIACAAAQSNKIPIYSSILLSKQFLLVCDIYIVFLRDMTSCTLAGGYRCCIGFYSTFYERSHVCCIGEIYKKFNV
jgi:hypothetical protein